jgi:hypothetical protein
MNIVEKNKDLLTLLSKCKKRMLKAVINASDRELVLTVCECILNCLNGNISLSEKDKQKLKKHKKILRTLIQKGNSIKLRKKLLIQQGSGFLPIILPTVISSIASLLTK